MELGDWVKISLGLDDCVRSAIEVNFHIAAMSIEALNRASPRFDEEALTAAMVGAFVAAQPLSAAAFPKVGDEALMWASYGKNDRGSFGERNSGADFALVVMLPDGSSRLAIFQAKSDHSKSSKKNILPVGSIKDDVETCMLSSGEPVRIRRNQIKKLAETAINIASKNASRTGLEDICWVHYLCQFENGVFAVPISCLAEEVRESINKVCVVDVDISKKICTSLHKILKDALSDEPKHWLRIDGSVESNVPQTIDLTSLIKLMPVVVGGSEGGLASLMLGDVRPVILTNSLKAAPAPGPPKGSTIGPS